MSSPSTPVPPDAAAPRVPARAPRSRGSLMLIGALLVIPIVVPLIVSIYARQSPTWGAVPFFFWFQFLLIPLAALFTFAAYRVTVATDPGADRTARSEDEHPPGRPQAGGPR